MNSVEIVKQQVSESLDKNRYLDCDKVITYLIEANKVFVTGKGRSGLVAKYFVNRLVHFGFQAHSLDEISTPASSEKDVLFIISGSGETGSLIYQAKVAQKIGLKIIVLTYSKQSTLVHLADDVMLVEPIEVNLQPMGTIFEQTSILLTDALVLDLMKQLNETSDSMQRRHANLE